MVGGDDEPAGAERGGQRGGHPAAAAADVHRDPVAGADQRGRDRRIPALLLGGRVPQVTGLLGPVDPVRVVGGGQTRSRRTRVWSRPGPTPIAETGVPDSSSTRRTYAWALAGRSAKVFASSSGSNQPSRYS